MSVQEMKSVVLNNDKVVCGDIYQLPSRESKIIRLFVSSTFTDMGTERNALMCDTFPTLHEYFRKRGFEFQVVDMRWGVREEAIVDHMVTSLCNQEINLTQKVSRGASFLALLGDKYGSCPLPSTITTKEYGIFLNNLRKKKQDTKVLEDWYKIDENSVPPHYVLLPLSNKYSYYNSNDLQHVDRRIKEHKLWAQEQIDIRKKLQLAADFSLEAGDISEEENHRYYVAVTESEIRTGILEDADARTRTFCILRQFDHLRTGDAKAWRYTDLDPAGNADGQCRLFLNNLKNLKIPSVLPPDNIHKFNITWTPNGVCPEDNEHHKEYIEKVKRVVYDNVIRLSEDRIKETAPATTKYEKNWYYDLIQHAEFCYKKVQIFENRRKLMVHCQRTLRNNKFSIRKPFIVSNNVRRPSLTQVVDEVDDEIENCDDPVRPSLTRSMSSDSIISVSSTSLQHSHCTVLPKLRQNDRSQVQVVCHKPVIIHGYSGYGKTSIMAKIAESFCSSEVRRTCNKPSVKRSSDPLPKAWLEAPQVLKIMRFLGTTPLSCSIRDVIVSVIKQIWAAFKVKPSKSMSKILEETFAGICDYFYELLWSLENFNGKVMIVLDAVDQLRPDEGAYNMNWVPLNFPQNVHMFISMLPDVTEAFKNIQGILKEPKCYIEVNQLPMETADYILEIYGNETGRTLTPEQKSEILTAFKRCSQPMFLKLAFDLAKEWKSFTPLSARKLGKNCRDLINVLFSRLESLHGRAIVWALQYITASRKGLSDSEIDDLLSLDDHVLQDVYIHHLPPEPSLIRLPPMLWRRIRQQLAEYLTEREADGSVLVSWYHRQFWETAVFHIDNAAQIHENMAEYFSGKWYNKVKPLSLYKGKRGEYNEASRNVPHMPNEYSENMPNLRKLSELPYHVILSYNMQASANLLSDFQFLLSKLRYAGLKELLADFKLYFDTMSPGGEKYADLVFLRMVKEDFSEDDDRSERASILKTIPGTQQILDSLTEETICVKIVYDLLMMAGDILLNDWQELAAQVVARLNTFWRSYERISKLVDAARRWLIETNLPLFIPRWACLQSPGGLLRTNINHVIHIPGRQRDYSNVLHLSRKGLLYVRELRWDLQDVVHVYDVDNHGEMVQTLRLRMSIESSIFLKDEKYMLARTYNHRNKDSKDSLLDFELKQWIPLLQDEEEEKSIKCIVTAPSEKFLIATLPHQLLIIEFDDKHQIKVKERVSLEGYADIIDVCIDPTEQTVVIATRDAYLHVFKLKTYSFFNHFGYKITLEDDKSESFNDYLSELQTYTMIISSENKLICRGLRKDVSNRVFVYDLTNDGDGPVICSTGENHPIDILKLHKSQKWAAGAFYYSERGATKFDEMSGGVKGRLMRPLYVWDIGTGKQIFRIKGNKGLFCSVAFLGQQHQFLAFSRKFDPGIIVVAIGTPDDPKPFASQLLKIGGHSKAVCCMIAHESSGLLITTSTDNTIKIWDLTTAETLCAVAEKNLHMQKPVDRKTKEEKDRYKLDPNDRDPLRHIQYKGNVEYTIDKKTLGGCHAICVDLSKSNEYAATGCMFGRVCFFNLVTGDFIVVQAHQHYVKRVQTIQFTPNDRFVMSGANEPRVMLWDYKIGVCVKIFRSDDQMQCSMIVDNLLVVGHSDRGDTSKDISYCNVWSLIEPFNGHEDPIIHLIAKFSFSRIAVSSDGRDLVTWNGYFMDEYLLHTETMFSLKPPNDVKEVENIDFDAQPQDLDEVAERCSGIDITPDDTLAVVVAFRVMQIANIHSHKFLHKIAFKTRVCSMRLSSDSKIAFVGKYRDVSVVDIVNGIVIKSIYMHNEFIESFQFTGDDNFIASVSQDKTLKLWNWNNETHETRCLSRLTFHCPIRVLCAAADLSFILVGPESAGPLAVLTLNPFLGQEIKSITPKFPVIPKWLEESYLCQPCENHSNPLEEDTADSKSPDLIDSSQCALELSESDVKLYVSGSLSMSISRESFDSCKSISGIFTAPSSSDNKSNKSRQCIIM